MDLGVTFVYQPIFNLMVVFYHLLGNNLGLAIIAVALVFRMITIPITMRQVKMARTNKEFSEKVNEIKEKYKDNKDKQNEEMMKIQSEYLPGQMSGCLSMIIQLVVFISLYHVISNILLKGAESFDVVAYPFVSGFTEGTVNTEFLGIDLTSTATGSWEQGIGVVAPFVLLALSVGVVQFLSARIQMGFRERDKTEKEKEKEQEIAEKRKNGEVPSFGEVFQQSTKQTVYLMPLLLTFMSLNFPAGISIYWTVQSGFVIIQQLIVDRFSNKDE